MKIIPTLLLSALLSVSATTARSEPRIPLTVAVFEFDSPYKVMRHDVSDLLVANLSADPQILLVERKDLEKVLSEQALGLSGNISSDSAAKVGQLTGAKILLTGRVFKVGETWTISTRIIGTETGRMYSEISQGARSNLFNVVSNLSQKIVQTITLQTSNLVASTTLSREERIDKLVRQLGDKRRPSVMIEIAEKGLEGVGQDQTVANELGLVLQKVGFSVVGKNSEVKPEIVISGSSIASKCLRNGELFTCRARLEIQAEERASGKTMAVDRQVSFAADVGNEIAAKLALETAADAVAERLLPMLAK